MEIATAEQFSKIFESKFPGISVRVERSGAERIFSRIAQEYASHIFHVDLVNTTDAAHALAWKAEGWLAPYVPADAAQHFLAGHIDPDGTFATLRILFSVIAYNTQLVKPQDAPAGFIDLLDPKWTGKLVKAHPGYSGLILTATHAMAGFGAHHVMHTTKIEVLTEHLPIRIEFIESAEKAGQTSCDFRLEKQPKPPLLSIVGAMKFNYLANSSRDISGKNPYIVHHRICFHAISLKSVRGR